MNSGPTPLKSSFIPRAIDTKRIQMKSFAITTHFIVFLVRFFILSVSVCQTHFYEKIKEIKYRECKVLSCTPQKCYELYLAVWSRCVLLRPVIDTMLTQRKLNTRENSDVSMVSLCFSKLTRTMEMFDSIWSDCTKSPTVSQMLRTVEKLRAVYRVAVSFNCDNNSDNDCRIVSECL